MIVNGLLLRKPRREIEELTIDMALNKIELSRRKAELKQRTGEKLATPWGLAGSFSAGCVTGWVADSEHAREWLQWSSLATTALAVFHEMSHDIFSPEDVESDAVPDEQPEEGPSSVHVASQ